jgi:hypothetical protein
MVTSLKRVANALANDASHRVLADTVKSHRMELENEISKNGYGIIVFRGRKYRVRPRKTKAIAQAAM